MSLIPRKWRAQYASSLKSLDTEEHIDLYFYRPLGFCVAKISEIVGITPNFITIVSIFLGIGAGIAFYFNSEWINFIGMLLLISANTLDSADGQLARMTHNYSRLGRILDGMAGDLWFVTIYTAICLREITFSQFFIEHSWMIWVLGAIAGASHIKQAQLADYYRQFHLFSLPGKRTINELEDIDELKKKYRSLKWGKDFFNKLFMKFYMGYSIQQTHTTPTMQRLIRLINKKYPEDHVPEQLKADLRKKSLPLMKYTNILSFNWRSITLFISIFIKMPWIYFVCEILVFNAIMIYMRTKHEKLCKELIANIEEGKYPEPNVATAAAN